MNPIIELFRFIGAVMVFISHYAHYISSERTILNFFWTGVYLFFVICGYVFGKMIFQGNEPITSFAIKRFFRIYPLYFISLFFYYALSDNQLKKLYFLKHLFFLNTTASIEEASCFNSAYWSLPPEIEFYVFIPVLIYFRNKIGSLAIYFAFFVSFFMKYFIYLHANSFAPVNIFDIVGVHLLGMLPEFGIGVMLFRVNQLINSSRTKWYKLIFLFFIGSGILACCACFFVQYGGEGINNNKFMKAYFSTLCSLAYALILLCCMNIKIKNYIKIYLSVGGLSYSVYLFHNFFEQFFNYYNLKMYGINAVLSAFILTLLISMFLNRWIEMPLRDYGKKLANRH